MAEDTNPGDFTITEFQRREMNKCLALNYPNLT